MDTLIFGDAVSEQAHRFEGENTKPVTGALGEPARILLPQNPATWEGGKMSFTMKVDPVQPNYLIVRLWGSDRIPNLLLLFCEGKQVGYRHLGDIDLLDIGDEQPGYNSRFFYRTLPLPLAMTQGKTALRFEIRSSGRIWGYGTHFEQYQKPMTEPTRGIYRVYTHTDGFFVPPADEKQGAAPAHPPVRQQPGAEVLDRLKERVNNEIGNLLASPKPLNQPQMQFVARAYHVKWTRAYQNPKVVEQVVKSLDAIFGAYRKDPKLAQADPATYNPDWFGLGPAGDTIRLLSVPLQPFLDHPISAGADATLTRRAAWSEMLRASRDWHRRHRRSYTNQSMINDLYGIYLSHRGVAAIDPANALPEEQMRRYLYESVGLQPWLGNDTDHGAEKPLGDHYYLLTAKGLTKELGYVGYYGEVLDWVTQIYDATRPATGQPGDEKIKAQLVKMARARAMFRYPTIDAEGNRAMRIETVVGWRDTHYPGDVTYVQRATRDASALQAAAATLDPVLVGYAQQMFADNQFFASVRDQMKEAGLRTTAGLLETPDQYELLKAQPPSPHRLPMTQGQPDFAFADEEIGVLAVKHGDAMLYASLYWRARHAINFLARVHYIVPGFDRIAIVREEAEFEPSGMEYTRRDWVNFGFANGGLKYPGDLHSAHAGEKLPIPKIPTGVKFKPGDESPYAGKADFYRLRCGPYLIAMNTTKDKTFELNAPAGIKQAPDLISGKTITLNGALKVRPLSTVVLYLGH